MHKKILQGKALAQNSRRVVIVGVSISKHASGVIKYVSKSRASEVEEIGREAMRRDEERQKNLQAA